MRTGGAALALAAGGAAGVGILASTRAQEATEEAHHPAHWTYEGAEGPEHWGDLDPTYASCSGGTSQSPIDVAGPVGDDLANIEFDYQVISSLTITNNGHTEVIEVPEGSSITLDGVNYPLKQFHFHAPSEHTINGVAEAMELHLVHIKDDDGVLSYAVVGVLLAEGEEHVPLAPVLGSIPPVAGPAQPFEFTIDLNALLPGQLTTYRYSGSLTTPPCTEGVQWLLMTERGAVSPEQVAAFKQVFNVDARPVQPLNDREVIQDTTA